MFIRSNLVAGLWVETVASAAGWSVALEKDGIVADAETGGTVGARVTQRAVTAPNHGSGSGAARVLCSEYGPSSLAALAALVSSSPGDHREAREAVTVCHLAGAAAY